jgi:hypothetical protein
MWYSLLFLDYKPVQNITVLDTVGNCNNGIILFYYNITFLWDHSLVCDVSLTETSLCGA